MLAEIINAPIPDSEIDRLYALFDIDLDYGELQHEFKDLTKLAAKVAGTDISMINLIDLHTQWTVSNFGLDIKQMPRTDSVCQYTIIQDSPFEIQNLSSDRRFKDKFYVTDTPNLRYYYGIPLKTSNGDNIGALCVLDTELKQITPEKAEMLKIIADEVMSRLKSLKLIKSLKNKLYNATESQKRIAHDIRGPINGIIGLTSLISDQGDENTVNETLQYAAMIKKTGRTLLELADDILGNDTSGEHDIDTEGKFNQPMLKEKLQSLYGPQALNKNIDFKVHTNTATDGINFSRNMLLQIIGNLVSNAIKFTPSGGKVSVQLYIITQDNYNELNIEVKDTGVGIDINQIKQLMSGNGNSTDGTNGEPGYGFGLNLVKQMVDSLKGQIHITSKIGVGSVFNISLPQPK